MIAQKFGTQRESVELFLTDILLSLRKGRPSLSLRVAANKSQRARKCGYLDSILVVMKRSVLLRLHTGLTK